MPHKLLLADDSVTIQRVIELTFADEDIHVTVVGDGRQAIERMRADRPDIVLADVGMPERDGYEVAAFIKGDPQLAHIPVILLTGAFEPLDEDRARLVGCDGVLVKPFEPQMVINRVRELLSGRRPVAAALGASAAVAVGGGHLRRRARRRARAAARRRRSPGTPATRSRTTSIAWTRRSPTSAGRRAAPASRPSRTRTCQARISELQQPPPERTPGQDPMTSWDPDLTADLGPAASRISPTPSRRCSRRSRGDVVPQPRRRPRCAAAAPSPTT